MSDDCIRIRGARQNNLKGLDLELPLGELLVVTGVSGAGKAVRVPVKIGYVDGEWIEVREGLKAGEQVVTAGKVALREGSSVQVIGAEPAKVAAKADAAKTAGTKQ